VIAKKSSYLNLNNFATIFVGKDCIVELYSLMLELKNLLAAAILFSISESSV